VFGLSAASGVLERNRATGLPHSEEWDELAERVDAPPFLRPGWTAAWAEAFGVNDLQVVDVRRGGELAAIMPLDASRSGSRSPVNWHTPLFGPVAIDEAARDELLLQLFDRPCPSVELQLVDGSPDSIEPIVEAARDRQRLVLSRPVAQAPFIELDGSFEEYESGLSRNRRKGLRRHRRKLEERGSVDFTVYDGSERLDELLDQAFRIEASGWKGDAGTAISSQADTLRFYTDIARWAADNGWLRLAFLSVDDQPIACDYALQHDGSWYSLKAGYDHEYRSYGPGALLLHEEIAHLHREGLRRMELLGTEDEFKLSWTDRSAQRSWVRAFRRTPAGLAAWAGFASRERARPLARRVKTALR
jgi:CelD/BcsL family acetyltransferase involved in cellulose biosynthesis